MGDPERRVSKKSTHKRLTVGMMMSAIQPGQEMWLGAVDEAREQGVNLICLVGGVCPKPGTPPSLENVVYELASPETVDVLVVWGSAGAGLLTPWNESDSLTFFDRYRALPVVNVERPLSGIPCILTNTYDSMCALIEHLIQVHGRRRIALIRGPAGHFESEERTRAWRDTLRIHGLPNDERLMSPPCGWLEQDGAAAMCLLLDERRLRPGDDLDAVVATEVQYAVGALRVLQERGIDVPAQLAVAGYNDLALAETIIPPVTAVRKPFYESGRVALRTALALGRGEQVPPVLDVPAQMIVRRSCGCWPQEVSSVATPSVEAGPGTTKEQLHALLARLLYDFVPQTAAQRAEQLLSALWEAATAPELFLTRLEQTIHESRARVDQVERWHSLLSAWWHMLRPLLRNDQVIWAERLWQQARVLVGYETWRAERARSLEWTLQSDLVRNFERRMFFIQDIPSLVESVVEEMKQLIRSGYLALYEDPQRPLDDARVVVAWQAHRRIPLDPQGVRYPTRQILPAQFWPQPGPVQLIVLPLYTQEGQLGFIGLEFGPRDGRFYSLIQEELSHALANIRAVEQRRQVEATLAQERALLRTLIDNLPDYVYIKDRQSRFVVNNKAHIRVVGGCSQEDLVGKTDFDFFPPEFARQYFQSEQELMARDQPVIDLEEEVIDQTTGEHQWVSTTKVPLHDESGAVIGFVGVTRNITALKQAEATLSRYAADMERRAMQIQTAAEIAREAAAQRELDPLLSRVSALLVERFGLSHALIFLLDDLEEFAVLRAAAGEMATELLSRGLRIKVGEGLVGHVAATGQFYVVPDTSQDARHLDLSLLPQAHTEAVLPLQVGGRVIGILDLLSERVGGIDDEDMAALSIVADQLALTIENVRLLDQMQQTVRELQASSAQYTREAWQRLARSAQQQTGYRYRRLGVEPAVEQPAEARRALELGEPVIIASEGEREEAFSTVAVPVRLRDQVIGVLNLRVAGRAISPEFLATVQQVSERLALSMESARLLRDTRLRAIQDRLLSEVSARIGESLDIETVLKRAVQEMRAALGLKEVEIRMGRAPDRGNGRGNG